MGVYGNCSLLQSSPIGQYMNCSLWHFRIGVPALPQSLPLGTNATKQGLQMKNSLLANSGAFTVMLINVHCP